MRERPSEKFQRKTILIKKKLQYKYMTLIIASVLIAFLIVGLDLVWTVSKFMNEHPMMQNIIGDINSMAPLFLIKIVMYMIIVVIVSAVVSHRMAGPVFKFERSVAVLGKGDLTHRVILRKGDHLTELQDGFNDMARNLQDAVKADRTIVRGVSSELKNLSSKIPGAEAGEIKRISETLEKTFAFFKV